MNDTPRDPTRRFSDRVADYVKYRPGYPPAVLDLLAAECGLTPASVVADVGSGTGLLAELFLRNGNAVVGIEPNAAMREAGEQLLAPYPAFASLGARAEDTGLDDHSVDFVTAGQAFHWFDHTAARAEFRRVLRPGGWVVLVWNERRTDTAFLAGYEALLHRHALDYAQVDHRNVDDAVLAPFFAPGGYRLATFANSQRFDFEGLRGRLLSSSYAPQPGHPRHAPLIEGLAALFEEHQAEGRVSFEYHTQVYYGQLE